MADSIEQMPQQYDDYKRDFHAIVTITLGELINLGWVNWTEDSWKWDSYNDEQYARLCKKIENRFWTREIGILPPGEWKRTYIRKMNEIMPKYKLLYAALDSGIDILQDSDTYHKERNVFSDYPQTRLGGNQDYASSGTDREYETVIDGSPLDKIEQFADRYRDVDLMILEDLEVIFSSLVTVNINAF